VQRILALLLITSPAFAGVTVAAELAAFYADHKKEPHWRGAAPERLVALLDQAQADELSGNAPWQATPYWGESAENPARELRRRIAESPSSPQVVRWFLAHETVDAFQEKAFGTAPKLPDDLFVEVVTAPHPNTVIVVGALTEAARRKLALPSAALASLCQSHRESVRKAARAAAARLGLPTPAPFDATTAVQSPPIAALMAQLDQLILEPAPPTASFVEVTRYGAKHRVDEKLIAWQIGEDKKQWTLLSEYGRRENVDKDGNATVTAISVEKVQARVAALRKKGDGEFALSEGGALTGQFEGHGAGLKEALLGHWLYRARRFDLAAAIILPALDTFYRDQHLVEMVRERLGELYGQEMLVAFAGDRDLSRTERLARTIAEHFPRTRFHSYATELAAELPRRRGDFTAFRLPTPAEWQEEKRKLSRAQQIDYFVERLRLLNCFQLGQPGGVSYGEGQTREPQGMARDASWGLGRGKTEVVNPWTALTGEHVLGQKSASELELTVADIPQLAGHLREDWHMPTVSFWRDFHPDRELHHTREALVGLINDLAKGEVVDRKRLEGPERDQEIERVARWARDHAKKSENDLLLDALQAGLDQGKRWYDVEEPARELVKRKEKRALGIFRKFLVARNTDEQNVKDILESARDLDVQSVKDLGEKYLQDREWFIRVEAAEIVLKSGDKAAARKVLVDALERGSDPPLYGHQLPDAVDALLADGARDEALRAFLNPKLPQIDHYCRAAMMASFIRAGAPEALRFYQRMLEMRGRSVGDTSYSVPAAEVFANELIDDLPLEDAELKALRKIERGPARVAAAKHWLSGKLRAR
jgi:hypothetical protein